MHLMLRSCIYQVMNTRVESRSFMSASQGSPPQSPAGPPNFMLSSLKLIRKHSCNKFIYISTNFPWNNKNKK